MSAPLTPSEEAPGPACDSPRPLVAFDFDGTLTIRDSFTGFLAWRTTPARWAVGLARLAPSALAYLGHRDRGRIKAAAIRWFLGGLPRARLAAEAEAYAEARTAALLRPDALAAWNAWRARGAVLAIVTASPTAVVGPFARKLGADILIGTELAYDGQDRVTGALATPNCRAAEKVVRLRERFGDAVRLAAAYGDTSGDTEMLALAEAPGFRVFTGRP